MAVKRNYKKEYRDYHGKPKQLADRVKRNTARHKAEKAGRVHKGDGKEIDHIRPLSKGGSNGPKNVRVVKRTTNRRKGAK